MERKYKFLLVLTVLAACLTAARFASAVDFGFEAVNQGLMGSLPTGDPRFLIGRLIQVLLSLLGVVAVVIIMYAGFIWMTSGGDEDKIGQAKRTLTNAVIGLVIILSAWAITTFVISRLLGAMGGGGGAFGPGGGGFTSPGLGALGACSVESVYPDPGQREVPRNTSVMITFKEQLKLDSVCADASGTACACSETCNRLNPLAVRIYRNEFGDACNNNSCADPNSNVTDVMVNVARGNTTLVITPLSPLGSTDGDVGYTVRLSDHLKKLDGSSMFKGCGANGLEWGFTVSNKFDLEPPRVRPAGVFPWPDDNRDVSQQSTAAASASGSLTVNSCPVTYAPAQVLRVTAADGTPTARVSVVLDYHGNSTSFQVAVPTENPNKAQLFDASGSLLGVSDFNSSGQVVFPSYLALTATDRPAGSLWTITIAPERMADTLRVGGAVYVFSDSGANNQVAVPSPCNVEQLAGDLNAKLSGHPDLEAVRRGNRIDFTARVAGSSGNDIILATTNPSALGIQAMSGGVDRQVTSRIMGKQDRPMNSVIQINFNEAINPLTVSGSATELSPYLRVVNAAPSAAAGAACSQNSDCRSYKCENSVCVGNFVNGNFAVSNNYRTVEFVSDQECGMNGCGDKIYCLPANSHLAVELVAADLRSCSSGADCAAFSPFNVCAATALGYNTCQNTEGQNYPAAALSRMNGITDAAINSLDGDRSTFADGPLDFYNENLPPAANAEKKDKFLWSFFVSDQIKLDPPSITSVTPIQGAKGVSLVEPIRITFSELMMNSSLMSGSSRVVSGTTTVEHKRLNLRSAAPTPLGYWTKSENMDVEPLDGEPDITMATIFHSPFSQSVTFKAQAGSGVKDIYQNCYKPSAGPGCAATPGQPSCCFGSPTATLGADGNCR